MQDNKDLSRRQVCQRLAATAPAAVLLAITVPVFGQKAKESASRPDLKLVPDSDPTAKALGYVPEASQGKREKKGAVEGKDQHCGNCQMYVKQGDVSGKEVGKCLMIMGGAVYSAGWCKSWVKKS